MIGSFVERNETLSHKKLSARNMLGVCWKGRLLLHTG